MHPGEFVILNAVRVVCDYEVEVATTNRFNAGTSAAPWVNLYGVQGATGEGAEGALGPGRVRDVVGLAWWEFGQGLLSTRLVLIWQRVLRVDPLGLF